MRTESFFDYEHSKNFIFTYHKCARNYFILNQKFYYGEILTMIQDHWLNSRKLAYLMAYILYVM